MSLNTMANSVNVFWHRRDLRLEDNVGLREALKENVPLIPVFIFDTTILNRLKKHDQRVLFIYKTLEHLKSTYQSYGSDLVVLHGDPVHVFEEFITKWQVNNVYCNKDYEPASIERDKLVYRVLKQKNISFHGFKDHVVFEKNEIVKDDGKPYTIYTPYAKKWRLKFESELSSWNSEPLNFAKLKQISPEKLIDLAEMGFEAKQLFPFPSSVLQNELIQKYHEQRDLPYLNGTSKLGLHLRFGTISIRDLVLQTYQLNNVFLSELIWRDFYHMLIYHFPNTVNHAFKAPYDFIPWLNDETNFKAWCEGKTGYPIVDAGMRELVQTGFMHNRVRMITASFLTKHLLIDWRWGAAFFAEHLMDFDLASNVGGWQWSFGGGCDAAPYFRVFNPTLQQQKFDPDFEYIKKWIPEYGTKDYPLPIVDHSYARNRIIETFKQTLNERGY